MRTDISSKVLELSSSAEPLKIERLALTALRQNPRNPKTHPKRQKKLLKASIKHFGQIKPVIIDENNVIIAGHATAEAAGAAGLTSVYVIRCGHLTEAQKRAYQIADNKIAEQSGWDRGILAVELGELSQLLPVEGLDVSLTGFETAEVDLLLADMAHSTQEPDDVLPPVPQKPVTRKHDLWLLGRHRLLCGDARLADSFRRLMNRVSAAALFCDPPYNLPAKMIGGRGEIKHDDFAFASGEMDPAQFREFLSTTLGNALGVSANGALHYIFIDWRHVGDLVEVGRDLYDFMLNLVVWNKSNAGQGSFYRSQHELIGVFRVGDHPHRNNVELGRFGRNRSNVWNYPGVNTFGRDRLKDLASHPTVKPVALVADALLDCTDRGDVVLDQFAGSGTILLAAEKVGRTARAMEYEPHYVDVAIQRWQNLTKQDATLEGDGRTFDEIAALRKTPEKGHRPSLPATAAGKPRPSRAKDRKTAPDRRRSRKKPAATALRRRRA